MKIIADDKIPFLKGALEPFADVVYVNGSSISNEHVKDADALIIRTRTHCNENLLKNSSVSFIGTATIGFDHIDTRYCDDHGIVWKNAPGCNSGSVMQYVASTLFSLSKKMNFTLCGRVLGVIGVGNVGGKIVKLAEIAGMRVYLCDPPKVRETGVCGFISLEGILRECDILTFHVPLNREGPDKTFHMISEGLLKKVNPGTFIINTSRGEVADSTSLKKALKDGRISGAALDVWENEPDIDPELLSIATQATPHIAGYSIDGKANGTGMIIRELSKHFDLPLEDWEATGLPEPEGPRINIDCEGLPDEEVLYRAVMHTYDVRTDDNRLRMDPSGFEKQRGDYPARREFGAYMLNLTGASEELRKRCLRAGFKVK